MQFMEDAAKDRVEDSVAQCMQLAESPEERRACVTGDDLKANLAQSLGRASEEIPDQDVQEYVMEAATLKVRVRVLFANRFC